MSALRKLSLKELLVIEEHLNHLIDSLHGASTRLDNAVGDSQIASVRGQQKYYKTQIGVLKWAMKTAQQRLDRGGNVVRKSVR